MPFLSITLIALAALLSHPAQAEVAKITCECGSWAQFPGDTHRTWIQRGTVTFESEVEDESYWMVGKQKCRKKYQTLRIDVANCDYASRD